MTSTSAARRLHLSEEEIYDIFRAIFHNEEDARAAMIQLFGDEDYHEEI
jgi:hypothetical protein